MYIHVFIFSFISYFDHGLRSLPRFRRRAVNQSYRPHHFHRHIDRHNFSRCPIHSVIREAPSQNERGPDFVELLKTAKSMKMSNLS